MNRQQRRPAAPPLNLRILPFFLILLSCAALAQSSSPLLSTDKTTILPEQFLRGYDPITVFFPEVVGPESGGPLDNPQGLLDLSPAFPGEYRWVDGKTLQFLPATAWPALAAFSVTAKGKQVELITLMTAPTRTVPAEGSVDLEPLKEILLYFDAPIDLDNLAKMLTLEVRPLPGLDNAALWLERKDFTLKELERYDLRSPSAYLIQLNQPIGYGKTVTVHLKLSLRNDPSKSFLRLRYQTKPFFRLTGIGTQQALLPLSEAGGRFSRDQALDGGSQKTQITVAFSDEPAPLSLEQIKALVSFDPAVRDLEPLVNGKNLVLSFKADRDTLYQVNLHHQPIQDRNGRTLEPFGPSSAYVLFRKEPAYLRWRADQGMVERFGPKHYPMEGRDTDRVDMRVYKVDPLDMRYWPLNMTTVDEQTPPRGPGEEPTATEDKQAHLLQLGTPLSSQIVTLQALANGQHQQFGYDLEPTLAKISGPNQPGTYLIGYRQLEQNQRHYVRVQVTDLALSVIEEFSGLTFFVTSLQTGKPIPNAEVHLENLAEGVPESLFQGTTDAIGSCRMPIPQALGKQLFRISVRSGEDVLVIDPQKAPPVLLGQSENDWGGWLSWITNTTRNLSQPAILGFAYPERPVYRPEEPVHLRGYLRSRQDGVLNLPPKQSYTLLIAGPGDQKFTYPLPLDANGNWYHLFDVADLPSGTYVANVKDANEYELCYTTFRKEAYRIPQFELSIAGPDQTPLDAPFKLTLTASYYAGGRVSGQEVSWRVTTTPYTWTAPDLPDFLFSTQERFSGAPGPTNTEGTTHQDKTDENGSAVLHLDPTTQQDARPRRYIVEATVRGADEQTVSGTHSVLALPPFVLGLKVPRLIKDTQTLQPEWVVLGMDGKPRAGQDVTLRLFHRQWHSYLIESDFTTGKAKYTTDVVDKPISTHNLISGDEPSTLDLPVTEAGVYLVELVSKDSLGRLQTVKADLFVAGNEPIAWQKPKDNTFEAVWAQKDYAPGDQATLVIKSPFQEGQALVMIEAPGQTRYEWVTVSGGQGLFNLTVDAAYTPKIPVHVLLLRGRIPTDPNAKLDLGKPISLGATTWLEVRPDAFQAVLNLEHPREAQPASEMRIAIHMADPSGQPLDGEVTLWLVDRAVLALGEEGSLDPIPAFVLDHPTYIKVSDTRNEVLGELPEEPFPGGDGSGAASGLFGEVTVRKNFKTVPFYQANIPIVAGHGEVVFTLPDNLTDFAVRAVATSGISRFGWTKSIISVRLPVMVQPALPRFVRPGDQFVAGGIGRVVDGLAGPGKAEIRIDGLALQSGGQANAERDLDPNLAQPFLFPLTVTREASYGDTPDPTVTFSLALKRTSDGAGDAFELKLPVKRDREFETQLTYLTLKPSSNALPEPKETPRPGTLSRELILTHQPALLKMLGALNYLAEYPHGCAEQRISRLLPSVALSDLLQQIGSKTNQTQTQLLIDETLLYLKNTLTPNGLIALWPGSRGYVGLTAYVLEFFVLAKEAGYTIDTALYDRAHKALTEALRSDYRHFIDGHSHAERALAIAALARAGSFDKTYAFELAARGRNLDLASEADILNTLLREGVADPNLINPLTEDLRQSVKILLRNNVPTYSGIQWRGESFGGLTLASEARSLASITQALYRKDHRDAKTRLLVDALIDLGGTQGWGDTRSNAAALLTLRDVLQSPAPLGGSQFLLTVDKTQTPLDTGTAPLIRQTISKPGAAMLLWQSGEAMPLAMSRLSYLPVGDGSTVQPTNNGFVINRELQLWQPGSATPLTHAVEAGTSLDIDMGTVVEEHLLVTNPEERTFVAICVPFAAGLEPMNPNLATSGQEAVPNGKLTLEPSYALYADDQVTFYYDSLPKGTYHFYFRLKASFAGTFTHPAPRAELMYRQEVFGRGPGSKIHILPRAED